MKHRVIISQTFIVYDVGRNAWFLHSTAQSNKGKWIYGFLIWFISIMIRVFNPAYPEGVFLAILLMNVFAPTIDHYVVQGNVKKRMKRLKVKTA